MTDVCSCLHAHNMRTFIKGVGFINEWVNHTSRCRSLVGNSYVLQGRKVVHTLTPEVTFFHNWFYGP